MEYLEQMFQTTLSSFDFTYCLIVNILTYIVIKSCSSTKWINKKWSKKVILLVVILLTGVVYWAIDKDLKLLVNSAILAPVSWDMIFKPVFKKIGIDYSKLDNDK